MCSDKTSYELGRWGKRYLINFGVNGMCIIFRILRNAMTETLDYKIFMTPRSMTPQLIFFHKQSKASQAIHAYSNGAYYVLREILSSFDGVEVVVQIPIQRPSVRFLNVGLSFIGFVLRVFF